MHVRMKDEISFNTSNRGKEMIEHEKGVFISYHLITIRYIVLIFYHNTVTQEHELMLSFSVCSFSIHFYISPLSTQILILCRRSEIVPLQL